MNNIKTAKANLRKEASILRNRIHKKNKNYFNKSLFDKFFRSLDNDSLSIISSFLSIKSEISTIELNDYILKKNKILTLPFINKDNYLSFRQFNKHDKLVRGIYDIMEPPINNKIFQPDVLFVPCLAFDLRGYRLGYGGGFYDKTFERFKQINKNYTSIGYAFEDQKFSKIPTEDFDIKLDYVITDKNIYNFT